MNPMIVEGQVHGGLVQGIGQALYENTTYDEAGQLISGSYMDYCMPRADDVPNFTIDHQVTACTHNVLGVKGCGEAGAIGSPPAVMINAIVNALKDYGVDHIDMPATPAKVWNIVNQGGQKPGRGIRGNNVRLQLSESRQRLGCGVGHCRPTTAR